jgi:hypothetical protein
MIPTPILYNENTDSTIMMFIIACCLIVLAIVMIPKAIRHRKRIKESAKTVLNEEQEIEMIVVPSEKTIPKKSIVAYEKRFLTKADIPARSGKQVSIRKKYHDRISKIVQVSGENEVTIFSYVDNVLKHHFETFQDEITELYNKNNKGIF